MSTSEQENHLQLDALEAAGVARVWSEKRSSIGSRPQLRAVLSVLKPGDVLVVYKLDRVARSLKDLLEILEVVQRAGAGFRSLTEPIDTSSAVGTFIVQVLGAVGQFERSLIRERAIAGQVAAYRRGVRWGGQPPAVSAEDAAEIARLRQTGLFTIAMLAEMFHCSEATVWRSIWRASRAKDERFKRLPVLGAYLRE